MRFESDCLCKYPKMIKFLSKKSIFLKKCVHYNLINKITGEKMNFCIRDVFSDRYPKNLSEYAAVSSYGLDGGKQI